MHSDLYIAQHANLRPVTEIAEQLGLGSDDIDVYGSPYVAKVRLDVLERFKDRPNGKYIDISAITPTPLGEGKSTTLVGLGGGAVIPPNGLVGVGPVAPLPGVQMYAPPMSGPASFGTGVASLATSGTGAGVGMNRAASAFGVPIGYVANTPLGISTATWSGQTLASLGITPGTYVWTWGAGPTADSFTLIVNAPPAPAAATSVPTLSEWGTISLAAMLALWGFAAVRRRKH